MHMCLSCGEPMTCVTTGLVLHFGNGHCRSSDAFECPKCHSRVAHANLTAWNASLETLESLRESGHLFDCTA